MSAVKIVNEGWARKSNDLWHSVPTTCYIISGRKKIMVDPGNDPELPDVLEMSSIWPEEVDTVFLTHTHVDHMKHIGLFENAEIVDPFYVNKDTISYPHGGSIPDTDIKIIDTPGHTCEHASLLVPTEIGPIVICGDLFWWEEGSPERYDARSLMDLPDPAALDHGSLAESRKKILELDAVKYIPGHGRPFKPVLQ